MFIFIFVAKYFLWKEEMMLKILLSYVNITMHTLTGHACLFVMMLCVDWWGFIPLLKYFMLVFKMSSLQNSD